MCRLEADRGTGSLTTSVMVRNMPRRAILFAAACIAVGLIPVRAHSDTVTTAFRLQDPRLDSKVTLSEPRVFVGKLCDLLSAATGIDVTANEQDGAADRIVTVYCKDMPVGDVMDRLWSLLSYHGAAYSWLRDTSGGQFAYRLIRPLSARQLADELRAKVQAAFEDEADTCINALDLPPAEMAALTVKDKRVAALSKDGRKRDGLRSISELLSPSERKDLLHGKNRRRFPAADLPPETRQFVRSVYDGYDGHSIGPGGTRTRTPEPRWVEAYVERGILTVPTLYINVDGCGAYSYLGGPRLQYQVADDLSTRWMMPGDGQTPKDADLVGNKLKSLEVETAEDTNILAKRLQEFSSLAGIAVLAQLPNSPRDSRDPGSPSGRIVSDYLRLLTSRTPPFLLAKWRGNTLLITHPGWFYEPEPAPWRFVKHVYKAIDGTKGGPRLSDLIEIAGKLSKQDLFAIAPEFPVLRAVAAWHGLFSAVAKSRLLRNQLLSVAGATLESVSNLLSDIPEMKQALRDAGPGDRVRLLETDDPDGSVTLTIVARNGTVIGGAGFVNRASRRATDK